MGNSPKVFGSFDLQYDVSEFERYREDLGYYNIDLMPECRVFLFGAEVSADVLNVSTTMTLNEVSGCSIQLANPRGKYTIQKADLCKRWREDKDILSAYNYDFFKKQFPSSFTDKVIISAASSVVGTGLFSTKDSLGKITRKVFETKFYSGLVKQVGDVVFDYRDPVMVFFKGRFSPYWYFGFTGVISGFDENNQFESDSIISINCESVLHMWKKQMIIKRSPLLAAGLFEYQSTIRSADNPETGKNWAYDMLNITGTAGLSWNRFVQFVGWGVESYKSVGNNSLVINNIDKTSTVDITRETQDSNSKMAGTNLSNADESNAIDYFLWSAASKDGSGNLNTKTLIKNIYAQCKMSDPAYSKGNHLKSMCSTSLIDLTKGESIPHPLGRGRSTTAGCNQSSSDDKVEFSSWQGLNLQYIKIAPKVFTKENELNKYFDASLRIWDKNPEIPTAKDKSSKSSTVTGWNDRQCFAIAGHHPALTYKQVNYFEFLTDIWTQIENLTKSDSSDGISAIDRLIVTPADKIREIVVGSNTSYHCGDGVKQSGSNTIAAPLGVDIYHMTYYRPRLYFIAPRRYNSSKSVDMAKFLNFDLTKAETTSCFDALRDMCNKLDYCMYSTPAGDIVVEPYMYDMQPTLFMDRSQYTQYYTDPLAAADYEVQMSDPSLSNYGNLTNASTINFGERSNHPLSIMNKDLTRITQTFDAHQIATSAMVQTSFFDDSSSSTVLASLEQALNPMDMHQMIALVSKENAVKDDYSTIGIYIADGLNPHIFDKQSNLDKATKLNTSELELKQAVLNSLINNYPTATLKHILLSVVDSIFTPAEFINGDTNIQPLPEENIESYKNHNYLFNNYLSKLNSGDFSINENNNIIDYNNIDIYAKVLRDVYDYKMWAIKTIYSDHMKYPISSMPLLRPNNISDVMTTFTSIINESIPVFASNSNEKTLQRVYEDCNTVYNIISSAYSGILTKMQSASGDQLTYLSVRLAEYKVQLDTVASALKIAKGYYITGVNYAWSLIDGLIQSDASANGKTRYESTVLSAFLMHIDSAILAKSNIKVKTSDLKIIGSDASELTTVSDIINKHSKDGYSIVQMLMPGSKLQNKSTGIDWVSLIYDNFLTIFRDYALLDVDDGSKEDLVTEVRRAHEAYTTISNIGVAVSGKVTVKTLANLKELASEKLYVPKRDLFRMYGYQPAPPKVFMYVDRKDKIDYAMMYLNQYIGQMYRYRIDIIGRPEMQLNRPHFIAYKDCIGLSTAYTTTFSYGSDFSTALTCTYIRKNSFSYAYSNNYLDVVGKVSPKDKAVASSDTGNRRALECFSNYYAMKSKIFKATKAVQAAEDTIVGGSIVSNSLMTNAISSNFESDIKYQNRGLQSLHDTIGHIDFDKKMIESDRPKSMNISMGMLSVYDNEAVRVLTSQIDESIKKRDTALASIETSRKMKKVSDERLTVVKNLKTDISNLSLNNKVSIFDQIIIPSSTDTLYQIDSSSNHGLITKAEPAKIKVPLLYSVKLSDKIDMSYLNTSDQSTSSYTTSFSFINKKTGAAYKTSTLTVSSETTWQNIIDAMGSAASVTIISADGVNISGVELEFDQESEYDSEVVADDYDYDISNGWFLFKNLIGSKTTTVAESSVYSFVLSSKVYQIDLADKPLWSDLVKALSAAVESDTCKPNISVSGDKIKFIGIKSSISGKTAYLKSTSSGQDLLKSLSERGFATHTNKSFANFQRKLNTTVSSEDKSLDNFIVSTKISIDSYIAEAKKYSMDLFGYLDVNDSEGSTTVKKLKYDSSDDELKSIISTWMVPYLQNDQSDIAKSAKNSLFGKLMMTIYDATKSKEYKLCYVPYIERSKHQTAGNYLTDEVTCYIEKSDSSTAKSANATALKKYVWYSSKGSAKNSKSGDTSVIFNCGCPTPEQYQEYLSKTKHLENSSIDEVVESRSYLKDPETKIFVNPQSAVLKIDEFINDWKLNYMSNNDIMVNILGYTSKEGEEGYNRELAVRRANLFSRAFQMGKASRLHGDFIPFDRIGTVDAFGEDPLYRRYNEDNKVVGDNRRVEIELINKSETPIDYTVWEDWNN